MYSHSCSFVIYLVVVATVTLAEKLPFPRRARVHMNYAHHEPGSPSLKLLAFCVDCPDPNREGSIAYGLYPALHRDKTFKATAELIYALPNDASAKVLFNSHEIEGRIALIDRGKINLYDKVLAAQAVGALGVVIADDGSCKQDFSFCGLRVGSVDQGGFAPHDSAEVWGSRVRVPVVLVNTVTADRLRNAMSARKVYVPSLGWQNISSTSIYFDEIDEL